MNGYCTQCKYGAFYLKCSHPEHIEYNCIDTENNCFICDDFISKDGHRDYNSCSYVDHNLKEWLILLLFLVLNSLMLIFNMVS